MTTISTILTSCNGIIGVLLPGFYFTDYDYSTDHSNNYADGKKLMMDLLKLELIIVGFSAGISLTFLRDKPAKPPSFVSTIKRENFKEALKGNIIDFFNQNIEIFFFKTKLTLYFYHN